MRRPAPHEQADLTRQALRVLGSIGWNPIREAGLTCRVCTAPIKSQYERCFRCTQHASTGLKTSPYVFPLTYAIKGTQAEADLHLYKKRHGPPPDSAVVQRIEYQIGYFTWTHLDCIEHLVGAPVSRVATVPSLKHPDELHPLATVVHKVLQTLDIPIVELNPKRDVPESQRRECRDDHFTCAEQLHGEHIVLIEDTWVTGGHAQSAAAGLYRAGASHATIIPIGRLLDPDFTTTKNFLRDHPERGWTTACPLVGPTLLSQCRSPFTA